MRVSGTVLIWTCNATHIVDPEELKMQDAYRAAGKDEMQNAATQPLMSAASGQGSVVLTTVLVLVAAGFEPEREFDPIPESQFVVNDAKVVFYDMLGGANGVGYFAVFETLGDEFDDLLLTWAGLPGSVEAACGDVRIRI